MADLTQNNREEKSNQIGHGLPYGASSLENSAPKKSHKKLFIIILTITAVVGLALFWKLTNKPKQKPTQQQTKNSVVESMSKAPEELPDAELSKEYSYGFLGISLKHPDNWVVTEGPSGFRLESPLIKFKSLDKGDVEGLFRIYIRKGARAVDGKYIGRGIAAEPSQLLKYSNPSVGQRSETYLTNFGQDNPNNFAFFLIAGNFNLNKGDTLGPDYGKEPETYIIFGGFSNSSLEDDLATFPVATEYAYKSSAYKQALQILESIKIY